MGAPMKIILMVCAVVFSAISLLGAYMDSQECAAKGGKRLRGILESFQCYDSASLKPIPLGEPNPHEIQSQQEGS